MISVIIPAFNEENAIVHTVEEIIRVLENANLTPYEVIVVDDGSTDNTYKLCQGLNITLIRHPHNIGYGKSLKDGISQAKFDTIAITDADKTYPFEETPKLVSKYNEGFDMVVGARTGAHYHENPTKKLLRKILKFIVEFSAGRKIPDINSGLRIFSKKTISSYLPHLCDTFSFTTSSTLAYMMTGKFVHYMPIPYEKREGQTKVKLFKDSLRTLQYILQAINYYNPIKLFILFAMLCLVLSCMSFAMSAMLGLKSAFLLGVGGMLCSLLVICFGLVADLLKQIMNK